jgi:hypothetical protein
LETKLEQLKQSKDSKEGDKAKGKKGKEGASTRPVNGKDRSKAQTVSHKVSQELAGAIAKGDKEELNRLKLSQEVAEFYKIYNDDRSAIDAVILSSAEDRLNAIVLRQPVKKPDGLISEDNGSSDRKDQAAQSESKEKAAEAQDGQEVEDGLMGSTVTFMARKWQVLSNTRRVNHLRPWVNAASSASKIFAMAVGSGAIQVTKFFPRIVPILAETSLLMWTLGLVVAGTAVARVLVARATWVLPAQNKEQNEAMIRQLDFWASRGRNLEPS